jgi:hypothetical protein
MYVPYKKKLEQLGFLKGTIQQQKRRQVKKSLLLKLLKPKQWEDDKQKYRG